jgi:hypothetical protein
MCAAWNYSSINRLQHILYSVSLRVHLISLIASYYHPEEISVPCSSVLAHEPGCQCHHHPLAEHANQPHPSG